MLNHTSAHVKKFLNKFITLEFYRLLPNYFYMLKYEILYVKNFLMNFVTQGKIISPIASQFVSFRASLVCNAGVFIHKCFFFRMNVRSPV